MPYDRDSDIFADEIIKNLNRKLDSELPSDRPMQYVSVFADDDEYEDTEQYYDEPGERICRHREKRRHPLRNFFIVLVIIAAALFFGYRALGEQPVRETAGLGEHSKEISTLLLVGTDDEGYRTDTIILVSVNAADNTVSMLSIPRDTYVYADYYVPKINSACGYGGGGAEGMQELLDRVRDTIGFYPDGYMMVDLDAFVDIVDVMGGVDFDVPVDMFYEDPYQDLYIDLKAGAQHLDGVQAMGLVRFRSGYAMADLERVNVQRDFINACIEQWVSPAAVLKLPKLLDIYEEQVLTDMTTQNLIWFTKAVLGGDGIAVDEQTLPGIPDYIGSGSYFVCDEDETAALMQEKFSPYR